MLTPGHHLPPEGPVCGRRVSSLFRLKTMCGDARSALDCGDLPRCARPPGSLRLATCASLRLSPLWAVEACRRRKGGGTPGLFIHSRTATPSRSRPHADKSAPPQSGDKSPQSKALRASVNGARGWRVVNTLFCPKTSFVLWSEREASRSPTASQCGWSTAFRLGVAACSYQDALRKWTTFHPVHSTLCRDAASGPTISAIPRLKLVLQPRRQGVERLTTSKI